MEVVARGGLAKTLKHFHTALEAHFSGLRERRQTLEPSAPVFALEHGLADEDVALLQDAVRGAIGQGLTATIARSFWLPFVVYATEVGYRYDGVEYWQSFAEVTPGWTGSNNDRTRVQTCFRKFAAAYGGAIPRGAWAETFRVISWPITHAVLPRYLQKQLAQMLYEHRSGWTHLLDDPDELGVRLASWSRRYSDRLYKFCQNTSLLGHLAVVLLLSDHDEESPYLEVRALDRIVKGLNSERLSRRWLEQARRSASHVRVKGFYDGKASTSTKASGERLPAATDPKLQLKLDRGVWKAFALLPDLKPLQHQLPPVYEALRSSRADIAGASEYLPVGGLLFPARPIKLGSWPWPEQPFIQLQGAALEVNRLIADQCRVSLGPWWLFRQAPGEAATEIKGKLIRPGGQYCLVGKPDLSPPDVSWCVQNPVDVEDVRAYNLIVPAMLETAEMEALAAAGISVVSHVAIRPAGVVASSWDGEGAVEWLAGEPGLIAIRAEHVLAQAKITIDDVAFFAEWPEGETEIFLALEDLSIGMHEVIATLRTADGARQVEGRLLVTVRDPQVRPENATEGEGLRLRTYPAQPSLPEIWDGRAILEVDGPVGSKADLDLTLHDGKGAVLAASRHQIALPVSPASWRRYLEKERSASQFRQSYDDAEYCEVKISRTGIGFAALTCERGFQGLRWVLSHTDVGYTARLVDRSDGDALSIEYFSSDWPTIAEVQSPGLDFMGPPRGGLLKASNGESTAMQIIPPDPNEVFSIGPAEPSVQVGTKSLAEVGRLMRHHREWFDAALPADPFSQWERQRVLNAITSALVSLLSGSYWAHFERDIRRLTMGDIDLNRAQSLVGVHKEDQALAQAIGSSLWQWQTEEERIAGFSMLVAAELRREGITDPIRGAEFLLALASCPAALLDWDDQERLQLIRCVLGSPVLVRAARFAILGTQDELAGGAA